MSETLEKLKENISKELDDISEKGMKTAGMLEAVDKLTHSLKSIDTILAMEDGDYSNGYPYPTMRYYDTRYSRNGMVERLKEMLAEAATDKQRTALKECISKMER